MILISKNARQLYLCSPISLGRKLKILSCYTLDYIIFFGFGFLCRSRRSLSSCSKLKWQKITWLFFSGVDSPASYSELVIRFSKFVSMFSSDSGWFLLLLACFFARITFITSATQSHSSQHKWFQVTVVGSSRKLGSWACGNQPWVVTSRYALPRTRVSVGRRSFTRVYLTVLCSSEFSSPPSWNGNGIMSET